MAQRRNQDGANPKAAAAGEINPWITFGIVAKHDFSGADCFSRDASVGLKTDPEVGSGATGASPANDLIACAQSNGCSGGTCEVLRTLGNSADSGLEIEFSSVNFVFFGNMDRAKPGGRVCGIRHAKLTALRQ